MYGNSYFVNEFHHVKDSVGTRVHRQFLRAVSVGVDRVDVFGYQARNRCPPILVVFPVPDAEHRAGVRLDDVLLRGVGLFDSPGQTIEKGRVVGFVDVVHIPEPRLPNHLAPAVVAEPLEIGVAVALDGDPLHVTLDDQAHVVEVTEEG